MLLIPLFAMSAACIPIGPPAPSDQVIRSFEESAHRGAYQVTTTEFFGGRAHQGANYPGPRPFRAVVDRIAGCGQAEDDVLHVQVFVLKWPWTVHVVEGTPGAEACIASVLSQLPLDADLGLAIRLVESRTTVAALRAPSPEDERPRACTLTSPMGVGTMSTSEELVDPARLAAAITCEAEPPVTQVTLRYERGQLAEVTTLPAVPCVEQAARSRFPTRADLEIDYHQNRPLDSWETVSCTLAVPLRAP